MNVADVEPGTKVGYHPVGEDDVRQVGIVKDVDLDVDVLTVTLPDDPGIEERVPFKCVEAIEGAGE